MPKLLVVENDNAWVNDFQKDLRSVFEEQSEPIIIRLADEFKHLSRSETFFDDVELALVDLELGAGTRDSPGDYLGRDLVLREIRSQASWIPVVLVSQYIRGDLAILAETTPYDFDAVLTKTFFGDRKTNRKQWEELRFNVGIKRIAALTGRSTCEVTSTLEHTVELDYGRGVAEHIERYGKEEFERLLKLLDLGSPRIVLDEVVFGYSGLSVAKAICRKGGRSTQWLLKFGTSIRKLDRELSAHRRMFEDGFTRLMSVPVFCWKPVVWRSLGVIAYEFEEGADTLFCKVQKEGSTQALVHARRALQELYAGIHEDVIVPRNQLKRLVKRLAGEKNRTGWGATVLALLENSKHDDLDKPVRVLVGCEHGDLHTRNILVGKRGPILIDFAHYLRERDSEKGVPLFDLAKLLVDLAVWKLVDIPFEDFLTGDLLSQDLLTGLVDVFLTNGKPAASDDERILFRCAAACIMAVYSEYKDVPDERREAICNALATGG